MEKSKLIATICCLLFIFSCRKQPQIDFLKDPLLDIQVVKQIAADPDFVPLSYVMNKDYLQLRIATYAKDSSDIKTKVKEIKRVADYFYYYGYKLQQKYKLSNTVAYLKKAYQVSETAKKHDFKTPLKKILERKKLSTVDVKLTNTPTSSINYLFCPEGYVFNSNIYMCDLPENSPQSAIGVYAIDGETGNFVDLEEVVVYGQSTCYSAYERLFRMFNISYPCGWRVVFGTTSFDSCIDFMKEHPKDWECDDNAMNYINAIINAEFDQSCDEYYNGGGGGGTGGSYSVYNRTDSDYNTGDDDNNSIGNYDNTSYSDYDENTQPWPTIKNVINASDFVGWNEDLHPNWGCMDYAKAQIAKKGYAISNYFDVGQTIQIYTAANGADKNLAKNAVGYLISALTRQIPVIVGVDDQPGSPNPNTDNTTDHFIVIVGTGIDSKGNYFSFYDNASGFASQGANIENKLYYNPSTGLISGKSQTGYANSSGRYDYIVTMIRKSK